MIIPIYNNGGLDAVQAALGPYVRQGDTFLLVSGNNDRSLDVSWLNQSAATLQDAYPGIVIMAATAGLTNVALMAEGVTYPIEAIVYVYEPNFSNEPEFTWDFNLTLTIFDEVTRIAYQRDLRSVGKPTGRPLLQNALQEYNWNYGMLGQRVDEVFIQTQTYCRQGTDVFALAIDGLVNQFLQAGTTQTWFPQVTVDPGAPNGVSAVEAYKCASVARARGVTGIMMWWSPAHPDRATEFLQLLNR